MKLNSLDLRESTMLSNLNANDKIEFLNSLKDYIVNYRGNLRISPYITFGYGMEYQEEQKDMALMTEAKRDLGDTWKDIFQNFDELKAKGVVPTSSYLTIGSQIMNYDAKSFLNLIKMSLVFYPELTKFVTCSMTDLEKEKYKELLNHPDYTSYLSVLKVLNEEKGLPISFKYVQGLETSPNSFIDVNINPTLDKITFQNTVNFILNFIMYANSKNFDEAKINQLYEKGYNKEDTTIDNSFLLADLIFKTNLDKINFLKQLEDKKIRS